MTAGWIRPCSGCGLLSCERDCAWRDYEPLTETQSDPLKGKYEPSPEYLAWLREVDAVRAAKNRRAA